MANDENTQFDAFLRHVVQSAPVPQPPANFAQQVAAQVRDHTEEAGLETWMVRIILALAALAVGGIALPFAISASTRITSLLGDAPWPLLLTLGMVLGGMKLAEVARPAFQLQSET